MRHSKLQRGRSRQLLRRLPDDLVVAPESLIKGGHPFVAHDCLSTRDMGGYERLKLTTQKRRVARERGGRRAVGSSQIKTCSTECIAAPAPLENLMHEITTTRLSNIELAQRFNDDDGMPVGGFDELLDLAADGPQVLETSLLHGASTVPALIFALPELTVGELQSLGETMPMQYNETTADLLENNSYLGWNAAGIEVRLDIRRCRAFPGNTETVCFVVIFVSRAGAVVAVHTVDEEGMLDLLCGIQACCISSGINYKPWRIYPEAELAAVEGAQTIESPDVLTADTLCLVWKD